jgi:23S rRNA pseudouridine1911/1915/1917 synthase
LHRLDRPVGGLLLFAKTSKAASRMTKQIKNHLVKKSYLAVVYGNVLPRRGVFKDYLKKMSNGMTVVTNKDDGKYAELSYSVLDYKSDENISLVEIELKTGRHHQIRIQFSSRGFPLCGDQRYGVLDKTQIALYAYKLEFYHPVTKELKKFKILPSGGYWTKFTL